ncbi:MAG: PilZ domain-containing protein [Pseudomonadota bacterium]
MSEHGTAQEGAASSGRETHYAQRAAMVLRRAKMVCQSGEYLCLIRDVSEKGIGLGFLHDVPPEPRTLLQLANDLTFPIERMWTGQRQAGYRFASSISLDDFLTDNSPRKVRPIRLNIPGIVRLRDGRKRADGRLIDISCEGAKIATPAELRSGALMSFELDGLPPQLAQVRWSKKGRYGLKFQQPVETEEMALCAMHLQPFTAGRSGGFSKLLAKARAA